MNNESAPNLVYKRQIEGVEGARPNRLPSVIGAIIAGTITALVLGSNALLNWTNNLPISPVSDFLLLVAQDWQNWMTEIGLGNFSTTLNTWLTAFQSAHW